MKTYPVVFIFAALLLLIMTMPLAATDMRALQIEATQAREELSRKAYQEKKEAEQAQLASRSLITGDRTSLQQEIARVSGLNDSLSHDIARLAKKSAGLEEQEKQLKERLEKISATVRELVGVIGNNAKDLSG